MIRSKIHSFWRLSNFAFPSSSLALSNKRFFGDSGLNGSQPPPPEPSPPPPPPEPSATDPFETSPDPFSAQASETSSQTPEASEAKKASEETLHEQTKKDLENFGFKEPFYKLKRENVDMDARMSTPQRILQMMPDDFRSRSPEERKAMMKQSMREMTLQVYKKNKTEYEKTKRELRASILFEDILKSNPVITLYEVKDIVWQKRTLYASFMNSFILYVAIGVAMGLGGNLTLYYCIGIPLFLYSVNSSYFRFLAQTPMKITWDTEKEVFRFTMRSLYWKKFDIVIKKGHLIYTEDKVLRKKLINYIDMKTMRPFSIIYREAWKNKALFSHLLEQRLD